MLPLTKCMNSKLHSSSIAAFPNCVCCVQINLVVSILSHLVSFMKAFISLLCLQEFEGLDSNIDEVIVSK